MQTALAPIDWVQAQEAVRRASARVTAMLRTVRDPDAPAVGGWNLTEVTAHLSHTIDVIAAMAKGGGGLLPDVWELASMTRALVTGEGERDLGRLADRIDASTAHLLALMGEAEADDPHPWLVQGIDFQLSNLTCHALNELTVHGRDIALAEGLRWPIPRSDAALVVCGFLFPSLAGLGRSMVNEKTAADVRASYEIHVRGGCRTVFRFDKRDLSVEPPGGGPVDCHLSVDPAAFLLVAWGRMSQWRAIPRGQLLAWGRRPWLGLKLRTYLKNP
jgi:uncharacterized protein (TIGR03083 family)